MLLASQVGLKVANSGAFWSCSGHYRRSIGLRPKTSSVTSVSHVTYCSRATAANLEEGGWCRKADAWPVQVRALGYRKRAPLSGEARQSPTNRLLRPGIDGSLGKGLVIELSLGRAALGPGRGHR